MSMIRCSAGRILSVRLTGPCNNNCAYCEAGGNQETCRELERLLESERREHNLLAIGGAEPTLRQDLPRLLEKAVENKYQWIQLRTNGRMFAYADYAKRLFGLAARFEEGGSENPDTPLAKYLSRDPSGNIRSALQRNKFEFSVSLHGATTETHEAITGAPGSFNQTLRGIGTLVGEGASVNARTVLSRRNLEELPELVGMLLEMGVGEIEFFPAGLREEAAPPQALGALQKAFGAASAFETTSDSERRPSRKRAFTRGIPFCMLPGNELRMSELYLPWDRHQRIKIVQPGETRGEAYGDCFTVACPNCLLEPACQGMPRGWKERADLTQMNKRSVAPEEPLIITVPENAGIEGVRADAVAHISGGIDSRCAAALYAEKNPGRKIALVTYSNGAACGLESASKTGALLMEKYPNVVAHLKIPIAPRVYREFALKDVEKKREAFGEYLTCTDCTYLMAAYTVFLQKKHFGGDTVITGNRKNAEMMPSIRHCMDRLFGAFGMQPLRTPVFEFELKSGVKALARALGLPASSAEGPGGEQPRCLLDAIKSSAPERSMAEAKMTNELRAMQESYFAEREKRAIALLEKSGVAPEMRS